jgi:hypothetical protein
MGSGGSGFMVSFLLVVGAAGWGGNGTPTPSPLPVPGLRAEGSSIVVLTGIWVAKYVDSKQLWVNMSCGCT